MNKKKGLSDEYLYIIYDPLKESITRFARHILSVQFRSKSYNLFNWISVEEFVQVGFEGVSTMEDGLPLSMYQNRAKNRMKNFARDLQAECRNEFKLIDLKIYLGDTSIYESNDFED